MIEETMNLVCIDQELFIKDSKDRTRTWRIKVEETDPGVFTMTRTSGLVGGKLKDRIDIYGPDSGKAGRTPQEQAELEAKSYIKKQRDKGYAGKNEDTSDRPPLPMKAKDYDPAKIQYPVFCQEKLNGICCVARKLDDDTISLTSIKGIEFSTLDHLKPDLLEIMRIGQAWEGQIYRRGLSLQQISSATKKPNENTPTLQLWVYDAIMDGANFDQRLSTISFSNTPHIINTFTWAFWHEHQADAEYEKIVKNGGEGLMYKNPKGLYRGNLYRSGDVRKRKAFQDAEFMIVGHRFDVDGCVIWTCRTNNQLFDVVPMGSKESRKISDELATKFHREMLTVRFSELSDDGIPQGNPVGVCIRNYE